MTVVKAHRFPVTVRRYEHGSVRAQAPGKHDLRVAVPPEFHGGHDAVWSPEELLATSVAACFAVTLDAVAERMQVPLHDVDVRAATNVERLEGRYTVTHVDVTATIETEPGCVDQARKAAARTEDLCLITTALDCPVRMRVDVGARPRDEALA